MIASAAINIYAITLFENIFKQISINSRIEEANFEPEPPF